MVLKVDVGHINASGVNQNEDRQEKTQSEDDYM